MDTECVARRFFAFCLCPLLMFSGEGVYGKYLDLYANHTTCNKIRNIRKRVRYLQYLGALLLAENGRIHTELPNETMRSAFLECFPVSLLNVP